jgi:membrane fusion protein
MSAKLRTDAIRKDQEVAAPSVRPILFRQQVAERNWEILASRGLLPRAPRAASPAIILLLAFIAVASAAVWWGALPRGEIASGYLEPTGGVARVRAPRLGIVARIQVADGQHVRAGDPLVTIRSEETTESGDSAEANIQGLLEAQRGDLRAQLTSEGDWRRNEARRLEAVAEQLGGEIGRLQQITATQQQQVDLAAGQAARLRGLVETKTVPLAEWELRASALMREQLALKADQRETAVKQGELIQAQITLDQLPGVASDRLRTLHEGLANIEQRLVELQTRRAAVVRAPVAGRVAAVPALAGAAVVSGSLIATVVPDESVLQARLFVPTRAIGKVHAGQRVSIRYDAFPYLKYGTFKGRVATVSSSVLMPEEIAGLSPVRINEPAYLLDVVLDRQTVSFGTGGEVPLRPDMLLSATVETDRRPLAGWLAESVFGVVQN